jgi:putrescine transport system substrate-binding protein
VGNRMVTGVHTLQDLEAVQRVLLSVRPFVRYVETTRIDADLANGEVCMAIDLSAGALRTASIVVERFAQR